jgi:phosphoribosylanthranilate isomerase
MYAMAKICGINTESALDAALDGKANFIGLVFFPKSPRHVDLVTARKLADRSRHKADIVALLVDPDNAQLREVMNAFAPDYVQLHGLESVERVAEIRALVDRPVIKAIGVAQGSDARKGLLYRDVADTILFDAKPPQGSARPGGHGAAFDWSLLDGTIKDAAWPQDMQWMLSGGLNPDNVGEAISKTGAPVVDVSSGVESSPGVKDAELIRRFLQAVKTAKQT